jgi:hypothetical protein
MDGDLGGHILIWIIRDVLAQWVREFDLSCLNQLEDRNRREHLVQRADAKPRVELVRDVLLAIRQAVGSAEQHLAALGNEHGSRETVRGGILLDLGAQRSDHFRLAHTGHGEFGRTWNGTHRKPRDPVWFRRLHDESEAPELIRIALLDEARCAPNAPTLARRPCRLEGNSPPDMLDYEECVRSPYRIGTTANRSMNRFFSWGGLRNKVSAKWWKGAARLAGI